MKLALMDGDIVPAGELRELGFDAIQFFFGGGSDGDAKDPAPEEIDRKLSFGGALAAMTLHVDLVGPEGTIATDVERLKRCVKKTADLDGRFGDNPRPVLIWHPSGYPASEEIDDRLVFNGLSDALRQACEVAERHDVIIAVEITRAGSVGSAETYLRLQDRIGSRSLGVCLDAANFVPDRTPLDRAVRMLGPEVAIVHGKDSSFNTDGTVASYGPTGTGELDYEAYVGLVNRYIDAPYFVLEYYKTREALITARDIVRRHLA